MSAQPLAQCKARALSAVGGGGGASERWRERGSGGIGGERGRGRGQGPRLAAPLAVRVEAVVADVLGAGLVAVPGSQGRLALERRRALGGRGARRGEPPALGLLVNPRVGGVDGLDGRGRLDPARVGQVLGGLRVLGGLPGGGRWRRRHQRGALGGRQAVGLVGAGGQVGVASGAGAAAAAAAVGPARQGLGAVLRRAARAPARRVRVVAERARSAAGGLQGERFHAGRRVRQEGGGVARQIPGRVVGRGGGGEVQPVVGGRDEPALRRGRAGLLGLLRGQEPVGVGHASLRQLPAGPHAGPGARPRVVVVVVEAAGLGVVADELVLQEGARRRCRHGVAGARHDLRARRVIGRRGQAVHVAARVDPKRGKGGAGKTRRRRRGEAERRAGEAGVRRSVRGPATPSQG